MTKKEISALTKKIISSTIDESIEASISIQELIEKKEENKDLLGPILVDNLEKEKNVSRIRKIIWAISIFEIDEAIPLLRDLIDHKDGVIREEVVLALGILKDNKSINKLIKILDNANDIAREEAAIALGLMGVKESIEPLIKLLDDDTNIDIVIASCLALSYIRDKSAIKPLINKISDDNKYIRRYSTKAVYTFGRTALPYLKESLKTTGFLKRRYLNKLINEIDKSDLSEVQKTFSRVATS